jgi:hypothetical protein
MIIVAAIASNVHHVVDGARASENFTTRLENAPAVQMLLSKCSIASIVM